MYVNTRAIIQREVEGEPCVYLQWRAKAGEPRVLELPGGRVEEFESLTAALRREVWEETRLRVTVANRTDGRVVESAGGSEVECLPVYAAYQTLRGPVDSIGFYFLCVAEGVATSSDETDEGVWMSLPAIRGLLEDKAAPVSWVDRAGLRYHLGQQPS